MTVRASRRNGFVSVRLQVMEKAVRLFLEQYWELRRLIVSITDNFKKKTFGLYKLGMGLFLVVEQYIGDDYVVGFYRSSGGEMLPLLLLDENDFMLFLRCHRKLVSRIPELDTGARLDLRRSANARILSDEVEKTK